MQSITYFVDADYITFTLDGEERYLRPQMLTRETHRLNQIMDRYIYGFLHGDWWPRIYVLLSNDKFGVVVLPDAYIDVTPFKD